MTFWIWIAWPGHSPNRKDSRMNNWEIKQIFTSLNSLWVQSTALNHRFVFTIGILANLGEQTILFPGSDCFSWSEWVQSTYRPVANGEGIGICGLRLKFIQALKPSSSNSTRSFKQLTFSRTKTALSIPGRFWNHLSLLELQKQTRLLINNFTKLPKFSTTSLFTLTNCLGQLKVAASILLSPFSFYHVCCFLCNHISWALSVATCYHWHDACIDDA